jgi:hypothetical protein
MQKHVQARRGWVSTLGPRGDDSSIGGVGEDYTNSPAELHKATVKSRKSNS